MIPKKSKKLLRRFFINIGTSGRTRGEKPHDMPDYLIRYWLMNFVIIIGIIILAVFAVLSVVQNRFITAVSCIGMIIAASLSFAIARTKIQQFVPAIILLISYGLMCVILTWGGESSGSNFLFIYVYPMITLILLGMAPGIILSLVLLAIISMEMFVPGLANFPYHLDFSVRMLISYLLVFAVSIVIDITRKTKDRLINVQHEKLIVLNKQLLSANEQLAELSTTDELTKLPNRRSFLTHMEILWRQCHRLTLPIGIIILDIDYFKRYNDTLGHLEGDKALIAVAQCMKRRLKRETDFAARFGGEEFICLLPFIDKTEAIGFANELVQSVEDIGMPHPDSELSKYVTISAGLASVVPDENTSWEQLVEEADKALYLAKSQGRNRLVTA